MGVDAFVSSLCEESPLGVRAGVSGGLVRVSGTCGTCVAEASVAGLDVDSAVDADVDDDDRGEKKDAGIDLAGLRRDDGDRWMEAGLVAVAAWTCDVVCRGVRVVSLSDVSLSLARAGIRDTSWMGPGFGSTSPSSKRDGGGTCSS
jgi:hypothetical protein